MSGVAGGSKQRTVYCEGQPGGPDALLLNRLLTENQPDGAFSVTVQPIGGKLGWGKFFDAFAQSQDYIALADRDFDIPPEIGKTGVALLQERERIFRTGLTNIECYVINVDLAHQFLLNRLSNPPSREELQDNLNQIVRSLISYHAVRWAFRNLRASSVSPISLDDIDKNNPDDEEECVRKAHTHIQKFQQNLTDYCHDAPNQISANAFDGLYNGYKQQF